MKLFNKKNKSTELKAESKLIKFAPNSFAEAKVIASELLKHNVVVIDVSELSKLEAIRTIDFLSGTLLATKGKYKKLASKTYLLAPKEELLNAFDDELDIN